MAAKKFSDLAPRSQGLILALAPIALAAAVFYSFVVPVTEHASQLKSQVSRLHVQNMRGRLLEAQRAQLKSRIQQAQSELGELRTVVPDQAADDQFVKMIYGTAAAAAVHVRSMEAQPTTRETYYTATPFKARVDGTYYTLVNFFADLANSPRIVNVSALKLTQLGASGGAYKISPGETVSADCLLTTFFNSPPPPAPSKKRGASGRR